MGNSKRNRTNDFVIQGSILAVASIVSRIIGMIYRIPLTNILTDEGNGYYASAYVVYNIALLLSSNSLPIAVSKLVAARVGKGERKNAFKVFKAALIFAVVTGFAAMVIVFLGANFITGNIMNSEPSAFALKVLAPTLFLVAIIGVVRGYFQGLGTMVPTAASQLLEQIINAVVSVVAATQFYRYGLTISETDAYSYGAGGGTLGTGAGALAALIFLGFVFAGYRKVLNKQLKRDRSRKTESYSVIYQTLFWTIMPIVLSTVIYNIGDLLDNGIFNAVMNNQGYTQKQYSSLWGIYSGKYVLLINVPVAIASAMSASVIPSLTIAASQNNQPIVNRKINTAVRFTMVVAIPCAVGLAVLAGPILSFIWGDTNPVTLNLLRFGSIAVVFTSLSTLTNGILQGLNRMKIPVRNAAISVAIHVIVLYVLLRFAKLEIYAQVIAFVLFGFLMCLLNWIGIRNSIPYQQEVKKTFFVPALAAAVMGVVAYFSYKALYQFAGNKVALILAIGLAVLVYGVMLLLLKGFTREELLGLPKGYLLVSIAEKLRLM